MASRRALITGSTSGIGLGIARSLAAAGYDIVLNGFGDADEIEAIRASLEKQHGNSVTYEGADLSKPAEIEAMFDSLDGSIDILVNNAGIQYTAPVEDFPVDRWDAITAINLSAVFHTMRLAVPAMRQRNWGRIINIASAHGLVASPHKIAYVAAKHAVVGMTKVVALETAATGVTCNAICPGWVLTPLVQQQIEKRAADNGSSEADESRALLAEKQPSGEFVTPEQLGGLAVFLCSPAADQMRGASLSMDGGWTAQ